MKFHFLLIRGLKFGIEHYEGFGYLSDLIEIDLAVVRIRIFY